MFSIHSSAIYGICAIAVSVETDVSAGIPQFTIVGLPDASVRESRERIRAAIKNSGLAFPRGRVTVNLAPAHLRKQGALYDLPIAISLIAQTGIFDATLLAHTVILGELGLEGDVRSVRGILPTALMTKQQDGFVLIVPKENAAEAMIVDGLTVYAVSTLRELIDHLRGENPLSPEFPSSQLPTQSEQICFSQIHGQAFAKRGLEIAAAGGHHVLLQGPPGTGKTMLARALSSILPALTHEEAIEVANIRSVCGLNIHQTTIMFERPFRSPHHSCSGASLIGGGSIPTPGEISLAHRGVLFLDELPEFAPRVLEHLRQPLEDGCVTIARSAGTIRFPSQFQLIATRNPCPCGYLNDPKRACVCSQGKIDLYQKRLSGPLFDRLDLVIEVPNIQMKDLSQETLIETSAHVRKRVVNARQMQTERFKETGIFLNQEMSAALLKKHIRLTKEARDLLDHAFSEGMLSTRGYFRLQKSARTIADFSNASDVEEEHIAEALMFRVDNRATTQEIASKNTRRSGLPSRSHQ